MEKNNYFFDIALRALISMTQILKPIRQGWKVSLPDVELNKFVRVASTP